MYIRVPIPLPPMATSVPVEHVLGRARSSAALRLGCTSYVHICMYIRVPTPLPPMATSVPVDVC